MHTFCLCGKGVPSPRGRMNTDGLLAESAPSRLMPAVAGVHGCITDELYVFQVACDNPWCFAEMQESQWVPGQRKLGPG